MISFNIWRPWPVGEKYSKVVSPMEYIWSKGDLWKTTISVY